MIARKRTVPPAPEYHMRGPASPPALMRHSVDFPSFGTIHRDDPRLDGLLAPTENRSPGLRLPLGGRPHLDQGRRVPAVFRHPAQPDHEVAGRRWRVALHEAVRLHRRRRLRRRARQQWADSRLTGPADRLRTRRPPHLAPRTRRRQAHPRRQLSGQTPQLAQRPRLQVERRSLLHRPSLRIAEARQGSHAGARLLRRLPAVARWRSHPARKT